MKCVSTQNISFEKTGILWLLKYSPPFVDDELGEVGRGCRDAGSSWLASSAPVKEFYFLKFRHPNHINQDKLTKLTI